MTNSLEIPLYANKPQRKVAGLKNVVAVTMYKSARRLGGPVRTVHR